MLRDNCYNYTQSVFKLDRWMISTLKIAAVHIVTYTLLSLSTEHSCKPKYGFAGHPGCEAASANGHTVEAGCRDCPLPEAV